MIKTQAGDLCESDGIVQDLLRGTRYGYRVLPTSCTSSFSLKESDCTPNSSPERLILWGYPLDHSGKAVNIPRTEYGMCSSQ